MNRPEGKVAVVTGGIRAFAREGARVAFSGTSEKSLSNLASSAGTDCRGFVADLSDPASPQQLVDAALQAFGASWARRCRSTVAHSWAKHQRLLASLRIRTEQCIDVTPSAVGKQLRTNHWSWHRAVAIQWEKVLNEPAAWLEGAMDIAQQG